MRPTEKSTRPLEHSVHGQTRNNCALDISDAFLLKRLSNSIPRTSIEPAWNSGLNETISGRISEFRGAKRRAI